MKYASHNAAAVAEKIWVSSSVVVISGNGSTKRIGGLSLGEVVAVEMKGSAVGY